MIFGLACGCSGNSDEPGSKTDSSSATEKSGEVKFLSTRKYQTGEGTPWSFDNTYYKLAHDKKLKIGYIGGSVTVGTGSENGECWREYTTKWFRDNYPNAEVTTIDSGYGGTSSLWGLARLQSMIIDLNPDLVFVEFSINDLYNYISEDQSAAIMEGIIRKINAKLPNCDIVIISVVDNQTVVSQSLNAKMHSDIAKYYGISWLDMGVPMNEAMQKTGKKWADFASDSVHPNKEGYKIYGDYIENYLAGKLKESAGRNPGKLTAHKMPDLPFTDNSALKGETIWAKDIPADSATWEYLESQTAKYGKYSIRGKKGAELELEFSGSFIAIFGDFNRAQMDCTLDGQCERKLGYKEELGEVMLYDNLDPNEKHTLKIKVNGSRARITAFLIG